ncbi:MAG TPA: TatD family hydrolase [Planctomycetota bacterium]|nr:TatD family hydrolase [Planctomycetota bacterium]
MILFDSHAHVTSRKFDQDRKHVLERAVQGGVRALVEVGCDLDDSQRAADFARDHATPPLLAWASVGVHPHEAKTWDARSESRLRALAKLPRVVAIGETGLDYYYDHSPKDVQRTVFETQLEIAKSLDMPVVLHIRDAHEDALKIIAEHASPALRGVAHCFSGDAKTARRYNDLAFAIAVGGLATFKTAPEVMDAAAHVALDMLLLETDCPYMAPVPHRGKRCEPAFVAATCHAVATARGMNPEELAKATLANASRVFRVSVTDPT